MNKILKDFLNWLLSIFIAIVFVFFLKTFVGMPTTITGTSMVPTFYSNEKLILSTWSASFNQTPKRGVIITFEAPSEDIIKKLDFTNAKAVYNENSKNISEKLLYTVLGISKKSYIKRVIGLPGDHVEIRDGKVYINGYELDENYLSSNTKTDMSLGGECDNVVVPNGYIYVLGDNRSKSADSRRFGCIPIKKIQGKVVLRWWPVNKIKII